MILEYPWHKESGPLEVRQSQSIAAITGVSRHQAKTKHVRSTWYNKKPLKIQQKHIKFDNITKTLLKNYLKKIIWLSYLTNPYPKKDTPDICCVSPCAMCPTGIASFLPLVQLLAPAAPRPIWGAAFRPCDGWCGGSGGSPRRRWRPAL